MENDPWTLPESVPEVVLLRLKLAIQVRDMCKIKIKNDSYIFGLNNFGRDNRDGAEIKASAFEMLIFNVNQISKCRCQVD